MRIDEFLLARIAEDEEIGRNATEGPWLAGEVGIGGGGEQVACWDECRQIRPDSAPGNIAHIARHDPARVLAECKAKRRIVAEAADIENSHCGCLGLPGEPILRALAQPYADHPDFDQAWRH